MEDKILKKASEMFLNLGFKSVTMDDIAHELGISKKTLYKYFSNKASLVNTSTEVVYKEVEQMIIAVKNKQYNAIKEEFSIKAIFKEMLKNAKESPMYQLKKYYPEIYTKSIERKECVFKNCNRDNLEKGISQGLYRKNINIDVIMDFYFSLTFAILDRQESKKTMQELLKMESDVLEYHIRAIATENGIKELEKQLQIIKQNN